MTIDFKVAALSVAIAIGLIAAPALAAAPDFSTSKTVYEPSPAERLKKDSPQRLRGTERKEERRRRRRKREGFCGRRPQEISFASSSSPSFSL